MDCRDARRVAGKFSPTPDLRLKRDGISRSAGSGASSVSRVNAGGTPAHTVDIDARNCRNIRRSPQAERKPVGDRHSGVARLSARRHQCVDRLARRDGRRDQERGTTPSKPGTRLPMVGHGQARRSVRGRCKRPHLAAWACGRIGRHWRTAGDLSAAGRSRPGAETLYGTAEVSSRPLIWKARREGADAVAVEEKVTAGWPWRAVSSRTFVAARRRTVAGSGSGPAEKGRSPWSIPIPDLAGVVLIAVAALPPAGVASAGTSHEFRAMLPRRRPVLDQHVGQDPAFSAPRARHQVGARRAGTAHDADGCRENPAPTRRRTRRATAGPRRLKAWFLLGNEMKPQPVEISTCFSARRRRRVRTAVTAGREPVDALSDII